MRTVSINLGLATASAAIFIGLPMTQAFAQTASSQPPLASLTAAAPASTLPDKTIQRIRTEDTGTRIDEIRVGGETQSITVQPKTGGNMPSYEIKPADSAKGGPSSTSSSDTNGARVWNVMKF